MEMLEACENRHQPTASILFSNEEQIVPTKKYKQYKSTTAKNMYPLGSKDKRQLKTQRQAPVLFSYEEEVVPTKKQCEYKSTTTKKIYLLGSKDKEQLKPQQQAPVLFSYEEEVVPTKKQCEYKSTTTKKIYLLDYKDKKQLKPQQVQQTSFVHTSARKEEKDLNKLITVPATTLPKVETISEITKEFCLTSTIDALNYIVGKHCSFIWKILFIAVTIYCIYQCILNVQEYLNYNLSTKITFEPVPVFDFPAITFCPMRMHKKSTVNVGALYWRVVLASFYANQLSEMNKLADENQRSCYNHRNLSDANSDEYYDYVERLMDGSLWLTNKFLMNYEDILLQCYWDKKRIDCSDAFINHISDVSSCFTFNPGDGLVYFTYSTKSGYGINTTSYSEYKFIHGRVNQELKLYININQSEYCGNEIEKRGAGLFFQIHGRNVNPSFLINPSTYISPGFDTKVVMEPTVYRRKTEHLGRCSTNVPLYLFDGYWTEYVFEHCLMQCSADLILRSCKCYPPNLGSLQNVLESRAKDLGIDETSIKVCLGGDYMCMKEWLHNVMSITAMKVLCPSCKQRCQETTYATEITSLLLSPRNTQIPEFGNASLTELRKNNIIVSFILKTSDVQFIVEEQKFTKEDLFIYIGNNIGLYLGMSFTTMFELLYFVYQLFVSLCRKYIKIFF